MSYAVRVQDGIARQVVKVRNAPPGWVASDDKVAIGSTYSGGVFTSPAPPPPPTTQEIEEKVQASLDQLTVSGNQRDKAIVMLVADVIAQSFGLTPQQARAMARDRLQDHLRTLNGI